MAETPTCAHCGRELEAVTIHIHHEITHELEWLVENRKQIAGEQNSGEVLERLIRLEFKKRVAIEESKAKTKRSQEEERQRKINLRGMSER